MLERRPTSVGDTVEVTFGLPSMTGAEFVHLVGDFNGWSREATPMEMTPQGFRVTLELRAGATYQFRYLLDGQRWENDWAADEYVGNEFGGENSVLDLTRELSSAGPALQPPSVGEEPKVDALQVDATNPLMNDVASSLLETAAAGGGPSPRAGATGDRDGSDEGTGDRPPAVGANEARKDGEAESGPDDSTPEPKRKGAPKGKATSGTEKSKGRGKAKGKDKGKAGKSAKSGRSQARKSASGASGDGTTKAELLEAARELDIAGRSTMKKDELAKAVAAARSRG